MNIDLETIALLVIIASFPLGALAFIASIDPYRWGK